MRERERERERERVRGIKKTSSNVLLDKILEVLATAAKANSSIRIEKY
jgi:hypothetical protein